MQRRPFHAEHLPQGLRCGLEVTAGGLQRPCGPDHLLLPLGGPFRDVHRHKGAGQQLIRGNRRCVGLQPASEIAQFGQGSFIVGPRRGPAESQVRQLMASDDTSDGFEDRPTVAVAVVKALNIGRQLLTHLTQLPGLGFPGGSVHFTFGLPGFLELAQHVELATLV